MKRMTLVLLMFIWHETTGQSFSIKWSDKFNLTSGIFTNNIYIKSLPAPDGNILSLFGKIRSGGFNNDYLLVKFNSKPEITGQLELKYPTSTDEAFIDVVKLKNNYYILRVKYKSKDNGEILLNKLNIEKMKIEPAEKKIMDIDDSETRAGIISLRPEEMYRFNLDVSYSADSSKLLLTYEPRLRRKDEKSIQLAVLNDNLEKVYTLKHQWTEPYKKVDVTNTSVDNYGNAYIAYNVYEKSFEKEYVRSDGDKIPAYTTYMVVFSDSKTNKTYSFNNKGNFIHQPGLGYNDKMEVVLLGMYKDKFNGRITGVFQSEPVNAVKTTTLANFTFTPFPTDLLELADKDDQGKSGGHKPGLDNDFRPGYIVSVSDGVNHLITEFFEIDITGTPNDQFIKYKKGDFILATFLTNGKVSFQRLPRNQQTMNAVSSTNITASNSFTPTYFRDKLLLFYNDDEDNINKNMNEKPGKFQTESKSVLTAAIMTHDGKLTARKVVFSHKDIDGYVSNLRLTEIKDDVYVVFAFDPGNFKHGIKVGILTIK
jgi:hypothetical protein